MADVKISQLPAATTPLDGTEVLPIVQSATTKQVSIANVTAGRAMAASSLTLTTPLAVTSGGTGIATTAQGSLLSATAADTFSATRTPTLGLAGTAAGTLGLSGSTSGVVTLATAATAGTWTLTLPTTGGTNGYILTTNGSGTTQWSNPTALGIDLDVGTTAITGGTTTRVLYNNAGVLGEYAVTGTGSVVLGTTPTFTTSALFPAGTVSAPGISVSGDTNTGLYFPAADNVAIATGGVAALTADSSQNVSVTNTLVMGSSFKRNRLINGNMAVWQRGTSFTPTAGVNTYCSDRWAARSNGPTTTVSQNTSVPTTTGSLFPYSIKYQRNSGQTATNGNYLFQIIESLNCNDLSNQTVTFSFWAKAGANFSASGGLLSVVFATGTTADEGGTSLMNGTWTGGAYPINTTQAITTTWTKYTFTGTCGTGVLEAACYWSYSGTGTAGADDSFFITGVQLEVGSIATPYERQIYSDQLAQCQRYYYRADFGSNKYVSTIQAYSTLSAFGPILTLAVPMRTTPTSVGSSAISTFSLTNSAASGAAVTTNFTIVATSPTALALDRADRTGSGLVAGNATILFTNATAYLDASAEL